MYITTNLIPGDNNSYICINTTPGTSDCEGENGNPPPDCLPGSGQNLPDAFSTCWEPVLELLGISCGWTFSTGACPDADPECYTTTAIRRLT